MPISLSKFEGRYVGLKLSCGSVGCGKVSAGEDTQLTARGVYLLKEAVMFDGNVEAILGNFYLGKLRRSKPGKSDLKEYYIAEEQVTHLRDITVEVEKILKTK